MLTETAHKCLARFCCAVAPFLVLSETEFAHFFADLGRPGRNGFTWAGTMQFIALFILFLTIPIYVIIISVDNVVAVDVPAVT